MECGLQIPDRSSADESDLYHGPSSYKSSNIFWERLQLFGRDQIFAAINFKFCWCLVVLFITTRTYRLLYISIAPSGLRGNWHSNRCVPAGGVQCLNKFVFLMVA